jgi:uncharacterized protein (TIGR00297 family)
MSGESIMARFDLIEIIVGVCAAAVIAFISFRFRMLSGSGAAGMIIIGGIIFGLGGIMFAIPLVFFFVSSSLLSFILTPAKRRAMLTFDKTGPRDIWQTLANGGIGAVCVIIYFVTGDFFWFFPYLAAICEATADTWATELGTLSRKHPVSIVSLKHVEPGRSGGVTSIGTLAALAGSVMVMFSGWSVIAAGSASLDIPVKYYLAVVNAGFAGAILDSLIGGSVQGMYRCRVCEKITEKKTHCGLATEHVAGLRWVNNDLVNLMATLFAAGAVALVVL